MRRRRTNPATIANPIKDLAWFSLSSFFEDFSLDGGAGGDLFDEDWFDEDWLVEEDPLDDDPLLLFEDEWSGIALSGVASSGVWLSGVRLVMMMFFFCVPAMWFFLLLKKSTSMPETQP